MKYQIQNQKNGMNKHYDILLVGSGLHNAVFARLACDIGLKCLVIEKRNHIGGNIYDEKQDDINVHMYGAHIFHTSDEGVWNFVNRYTSFNNYINSPVAKYDKELYNLPFNMNTFHQMWKDVISPQDALKKINSQKINYNTHPKNLEEQALSLVGKDIYKKLIKGYTEKQWGKTCDELPPEIIKRLPLRFTYNNNYFNDKYQGIPINGYTDLINKLFSECDIIINTDYFNNKEYFNSIADTIIYSGQIDKYFDYCFGELEYRSLKFTQIKYLCCPNFQGNAVVNYTDKNTPFTRIIEHKHFDVWNENVKQLEHTIITREFPISYKNVDGTTNEPYYPINNEKNMSIYNKYKELTYKLPNVIFGGRLGEYKYYDMDKVIKSAMGNFKLYKNRKGED